MLVLYYMQFDIDCENNKFYTKQLSYLHKCLCAGEAGIGSTQIELYLHGLWLL